MAQKTLFSILLRQPWWVTLLVAFALFAIVHAIFPPVAPFMALPFAGLAIYIGYRQWRGNAPVDAAERLTSLRSMAWDEFSALLTQAFQRRGYHVSTADGPGYDFKLTKDGRITLLHCRRWKVNQVGVGPVRELANAVARNEAYKGICVAAGEFSEPARKLTSTEPVALVSGNDLVDLVGAPRRKKRRLFARHQ
jgi:restriction system protein